MIEFLNTETTISGTIKSELTIKMNVKGETFHSWQFSKS